METISKPYLSLLSIPKAAAAAKRDKTAMAAGNKVAGGTDLHALGNLRPGRKFCVKGDKL